MQYTKESFDSVYKEHYKLVKNFCNQRVGNKSKDAEDLAQNVFIKAFININKFDGKRASIKTWLCSIAKNECYEFQKRFYTRSDILVDYPEIFFSKLKQEEYENEYENGISEKIDKVFAIVNNLDPVKSRIIHLRYMNGLTSAEVGKITNLSADAIRQTTNRIFKKIRNEFN